MIGREKVTVDKFGFECLLCSVAWRRLSEAQRRELIEKHFERYVVHPEIFRESVNDYAVIIASGDIGPGNLPGGMMGDIAEIPINTVLKASSDELFQLIKQKCHMD